MKFKSFVLLLGMLATPVLAADYTVESSSTLGFSGTFQGEEFSGTFKRFVATIYYDPANLASSKFDVNIDLASASTGDKDRDDALPGEEFFNIGKFPSAHFVTTQFRQSGDAVIAEGTLSLKGISKPVSLNVKFATNAAGAILDVSTTLERLEFTIGSGEYADTSTIGNEIAVAAHLQLTAK